MHRAYSCQFIMSVCLSWLVIIIIFLFFPHRQWLHWGSGIGQFFTWICTINQWLRWGSKSGSVGKKSQRKWVRQSDNQISLPLTGWLIFLDNVNQSNLLNGFHLRLCVYRWGFGDALTANIRGHVCGAQGLFHGGLWRQSWWTNRDQRGERRCTLIDTAIDRLTFDFFPNHPAGPVVASGGKFPFAISIW